MIVKEKIINKKVMSIYKSIKLKRFNFFFNKYFKNNLYKNNKNYYNSSYMYIKKIIKLNNKEINIIRFKIIYNFFILTTLNNFI